jgi:hypothetical protein
MGYADPHELGPLNAAIDDAARRAGRDPSTIRRLYNITSLDGGAERLAELTLDQGMSTYILAVDDERAVRVFAEEIAPAVRELVERGRAGAATAPPAPAGTAAPFAVVPTPDDGTRLSDDRPWDEATRPSGPPPEPGARYTPDQQAAGQHLIDVHDHLRSELTQLRQLIGQLARGTVDPSAVRGFINRMTIRQNHWTLGVYCLSYCRMVTGHHSLEDTSVFPHLKQREPGLTPVLDRLFAEHEVISDLLEQVDVALNALATDHDLGAVQAAVDRLTDAMASHFSYEERELVEPLSRLGFY